jgi:hypothetical protein
MMAVMTHKPIEFEWVVTGDESWFYDYYFCDAVWAALRDPLFHRIKQNMTHKNVF